ncbi:MAG: S1/P1 nuclease, partial [Flavobacteriaceae bacterium]
HQPLHVSRKEDRGGNGIRLRWRGRSTNLHRLWDTQLLEDYQDFNALMDQFPIPTGVQVRDIASQTLAQWVAETHALAYEVYDNAPPNSNLSSLYQKENLPLVYQQLQKAGLRLAATLNTIFK